MVLNGLQTLGEVARNDSVAVGTSSVVISEIRLMQNPRRDILVRNISPNAADIITVNIGPTIAVANVGIILRQYENFSFSSEVSNPCPQGQFTAICATANGVLAIMER
jgi:hypothetical protein